MADSFNGSTCGSAMFQIVMPWSVPPVATSLSSGLNEALVIISVLLFTCGAAVHAAVSQIWIPFDPAAQSRLPAWLKVIHIKPPSVLCTIVGGLLGSAICHR